MLQKRISLISAVASAVLSLAPIALADAPTSTPTVDELKQQIADLQKRLDSVEQQQNAAANRAEVQKTVDAMIKDAEARSKFFSTDGDFNAGYDKGFFLKSADGNFLMRPGVLFQFRDVTTATDGDVQNGFEIRRFRPGIEGNLFSPEFTYKFVLDVNRNGGETTLLDAVVQYKFAPRWAVKAGQFRNSWVHEGDVPDTAQLAVERSMIDAVLAGSQTNRVQGVALVYGASDVPLRAEFTYDDGDDSMNTGFQDTDTDFGMSGRVEYKFSGDWTDYRTFTARQNKKDMFVVGGGVDWSQGDQNIVRTTVDAQYETSSRWILYGELNGNVDTTNDTTDFDWGVLGQIGYAIDMHWEPFFRYDVVSDDTGLEQQVFNEITIGVNYYCGPNGSYNERCKFTVDMGFLPEGAPAGTGGEDYVVSDDFEFVLRAQLQLVL